MPLQILKTYQKKTAYEILSIKANINPGAIKHNNKWYLFANANYVGIGTQVIDSQGVFAWNTYRSKYADLIKSVCLNDTEIHLFYRNKNSGEFTYFGLIKNIEYFEYFYDAKDTTFFLSQIQDWELIKTKQKELLTRGIMIKPYPHDSLKSKISDTQNKFEEGSPLLISPSWNQEKQEIDYIDILKKNQELGLKGELEVIKYEKNRLNNLGKKDLVNQIKHVSKDIGDGLGYDILSFNEDESFLYIEVKTTICSEKQAFYITKNELEFLKNEAQARIYRVYNFSEDRNDIGLNIYSKEDFVDTGKLGLEAISFKVKIKDS